MGPGVGLPCSRGDRRTAGDAERAVPLARRPAAGRSGRAPAPLPARACRAAAGGTGRCADRRCLTVPAAPGRLLPLCVRDGPPREPEAALEPGSGAPRLRGSASQ